MISNKLTKQRLLQGLTALAAVSFLFIWFVRLGDSLWSDEAFTGILLRLDPGEIIRVIAHENNPPLYYLLLYPFRLVLGQTELALRLPSLIFAIITFSLLRYELRRQPVIRELASIFFLINSNLYYSATEARYYAWLMLVFFINFMLVHRLRRGRTTLLKLAYIFAAAVLLYSHSLGLILFAVNSIYLCAPAILSLTRDFKRKLWPALQPNIYLAVPLLAYLPWAFVLVRQVATQQELGFWLQFHPLISLKHLLTLLWLPGANQGKLLSLLEVSPWLLPVLLFVVVAMLFFIYSLRELTRAQAFRDFAYPFTTLIAFYAVSFIFPVFFARYFSFLLPFTAVALAIGSMSIYRQATLAKSALLLSLVGVSLLAFSLIFFSLEVKMPIRDAVEDLATSDASVMIATYDEYQYLACLYYFDDCQLLYSLDEIDENIGVSLFPYIQTTTTIPAEVETVLVLHNAGHALKIDWKLNEFVLNDCQLYGSSSQYSEHLSVCTYLRVSD